MLLDYDRIVEWAPSLTGVLRPIVPAHLSERVAAADPDYIEDARNLVIEVADREAVIDAVLDWVASNRIAAYHGTRLTTDELTEIQATGLVPLQANRRRERLRRALSRHPRWEEIEQDLDAAIAEHGSGQKAGKREAQVHLTLSKAGLVEGFNQYLTYGSEFDQVVALSLLGNEGKRLLKEDGEPVVLKFAVPGRVALTATHPFFTVEEVRRKGGVPNIVDEFLSAWAFRLSREQFQTASLHTDCGLMFRSTVPSDWLINETS